MVSCKRVTRVVARNFFSPSRCTRRWNGVPDRGTPYSRRVHRDSICRTSSPVRQTSNPALQTRDTTNQTSNPAFQTPIPARATRDTPHRITDSQSARSVPVQKTAAALLRDACKADGSRITENLDFDAVAWKPRHVESGFSRIIPAAVGARVRWRGAKGCDCTPCTDKRRGDEVTFPAACSSLISWLPDRSLRP